MHGGRLLGANIQLVGLDWSENCEERHVYRVEMDFTSRCIQSAGPAHAAMILTRDQTVPEVFLSRTGFDSTLISVCEANISALMSVCVWGGGLQGVS